MEMQNALINPEIILTDYIPIGSGEFMTPEYDQALSRADVYPWYWDLKLNRFLLSPHGLDLLPQASEEGIHLFDLVEKAMMRGDIKRFNKVLKSTFRNESMEDQNFRILHPHSEKPVWMRISGQVLKKDGRIQGALGHIRNISMSVNLEASIEESRDFLTNLINLIPLPIYYKNPMGYYEFFNSSFEKYMARPADKILGKSVYNLYSRDAAERFTADDIALIDKKDFLIYTDHVLYPDGQERDVEVYKMPDLSRDDGSVKGIAGCILDLTEQKRASLRIRRLNAIMELVLEVNHAILSIPDMESLLEYILGKIQTVIPSADCGSILINDNGTLHITASFGYVKKGMKDIAIPLEQSLSYDRTKGAILKTRIIEEPDEKIVKNGGPPMARTRSGERVRAVISTPIYRDGELLGLFSLDSVREKAFTEEDTEVMDYLNEQLALVLDRQDLYQKVLGLSRFDSLTGLSNRHYFQEQGEVAIKLAERRGDNLIVLLADLDGLKPVNDFWGHEAGDAMIRCFSEMLQNSFRDSDILGRLGGDEFTGLFHDTAREDLDERFEKIRKNPPRFPVSDGGTVACRFSYGLAVFPADGRSLEALTRVADMRMYEMKERSPFRRGKATRESLLNS